MFRKVVAEPEAGATSATVTADTDTGPVSKGTQEKGHEVGATEKDTDGKVSATTDIDYERVQRATGAETETEATRAHSEAGKMGAGDAPTIRNKGIRTPSEDEQPPQSDQTVPCTFYYNEIMSHGHHETDARDDNNVSRAHSRTE